MKPADVIIDQYLNVRAPWVQFILRGQNIDGRHSRKTHEMRTAATKMRGWFALAQSGDKPGDRYLYGLIKIVDSLGPQTAEEMIRNRAHNHENPIDVRQMFADRAAYNELFGNSPELASEIEKPKLYNHAWVLANATPFEQPIALIGRDGPVQFVPLADYFNKRTGKNAQVLTDENKQRLAQEAARIVASFTVS